MVEHWNVDSYVPFPIGGSDFQVRDAVVRDRENIFELK